MHRVTSGLPVAMLCLALAPGGARGAPAGRTIYSVVPAPARGAVIRSAVASAATTGNLLVLVDQRRSAEAAARSTVQAAVARFGARLAGKSVPQIGLITVRPPAGVSPAAFARLLRRLTGVASVQPERRYVPRAVPDDPALTTPDPYSGTLQWTLAAEGFYKAWSVSNGAGALVGVIDTGIDADHPDLATKIAAAVNQQDPSDARGSARTDEVGHGTHVASLACAATDNGFGMAGAGYDCRLVVEKSDFSDSSVAASIVDAADRGVQALNMSFGPSSASAGPAPQAEVRALYYAAARKVVLVAAAADAPMTDQGDPADVVQPAGTAREISRGIGLDVTAADHTAHRADFAGYGNEISMAAYGAFDPEALGLVGFGPPQGLFGAFPANATDLEALPSPCGCRTSFHGSDSWAFLAGTSMAAPQVAAAAAMMRVLNPFATLGDILRTLKETAQRPPGAGWSSDLGWGILDAGAALEAARRIDRLAPVSSVSAPRVSARTRFVLRWSGHDRRWGKLIPSGIASYAVYAAVHGARARLIERTTRHSLTFHGVRGARYVFYTVAVDRAGNREAHPRRVATTVA